MKNTIVKAILAATMLVSMVVVQEGPISAAAATVVAGKTTTPVPVMTDNLSKYGLQKDVELPVTVTAGGLSYTLHKIMIFDFDSQTALALRKLYKYPDNSQAIFDPQYMVWTKITITNNSKKTVERSVNDMLYKWRLFFENGMEADPAMAVAKLNEPNSKEALRNFKLKPGESLTTYQALYYKGDFKYFRISLEFSGEISKIYVVNKPVITK